MSENKVFWGDPHEANYELILDYFSGTKINSTRTSSVPLAQYWKETKNTLEHIGLATSTNLQGASVYFEYPTRSFGKNRPSMSDVMIISENTKVAVEAKFTEYARTEYETIDSWYKNRPSEQNRRDEPLAQYHFGVFRQQHFGIE